MVAATYAQFGEWERKHHNFASHFEIIICDEVHNLFYFSKFGQEPNPASIARDAICAASAGHQTKVIGITATPKALYKLWCPKYFIPIDPSILRQYDETVVYYSELEPLLRRLPPEQIGALYTSSVQKIIEYVELLRSLGRKPLALWSLTYETPAMDEEQIAARKYILEHEELPPQYDFFVFNASCETAINLRGKIHFIIVHNNDTTHITQARGRYRGDLEALYLHDVDKCAVVVPPEYLNRRLYKQDFDELRAALGITDPNDHKRWLPWKRLKQLLTLNGYIVADECRDSKGRYKIITTP